MDLNKLKQIQNIVKKLKLSGIISENEEKIPIIDQECFEKYQVKLLKKIH